MSTQQFPWTAQGVAEWNRIRRKVDGLRCAGMPYNNAPDSITIGPPPQTASSSPSEGGATPPKGQFQGMLYQMTTQNQTGFDWLIAHTLL